MPTIETERLIIRNFKPEDWRDLYEYISQKEVRKFEPQWDPSEEACQKAAEEFSKGNTFWAAQLKDNGKIIGQVYFNQIEPAKFLTWELGYIFNPQFHGKGYASESCKAVLQFAFDIYGTHRVIATCNPENVRSWKLMERLAMRREGCSVKCVTRTKTEEGNPIWWDEYRYAILAEEWGAFECKVRE